MAGIVEAMKDGEEKSLKGQEVIETSSSEMEYIAEHVGTVNGGIHAITAILSQQAEASGEVSKGVSAIARMSAQSVDKIENVIGMLEQTEKPIIEDINDLVTRGGPTATIFAAKSDHMIWMRKLSQMLAGRAALKPDELADHHNCRLGKWYDNIDNPALTAMPEWEMLKEPHKNVHVSGIEAARRYDNGDIEGAIDAVHEASEASIKVMALLTKIGERIQ